MSLAFDPSDVTCAKIRRYESTSNECAIQIGFGNQWHCVFQTKEQKQKKDIKIVANARFKSNIYNIFGYWKHQVNNEHIFSEGQKGGGLIYLIIKYQTEIC